MLRRTCWILLLVSIATSISAQQTIYWKKDHIYNGSGGKEIAVMMPAPTDQTAPTAPTGLSYSLLTGSSVQLSWSSTSTDSGGSGLAGYKVYRQQGSGANLPVGTVVPGVGVVSFTDQPLTPSTSYTYTVVAFDNAENYSTASTSISITTSTAPADTTAPSVPTNLSGIAPTASAAQLNWNVSIDAGGSGLAGYRVYRNGTLAGSPTTNSFTDTGVSSKTTYTYTVSAFDNAGNASSQSSAVSVTTPWTLVFTDNFNRSDSANTLNNANWLYNGAGYYWGIHSNLANLPNTYYQQVANWTDVYAAATQASFRETLSLPVPGDANSVGIAFWSSGSTYCYVYGTCATYRAYITWNSYNGFGHVYLYYYDSQANSYYLGGASIYALGTLRVQANSSTRAITVSVNGVQQISYTETDTTRANSGSVGITGYMYQWMYLDTNVSAFTLEN